MDGDPAVEPELDTFSLILPLPYRIAVILVLGMADVDGNPYHLQDSADISSRCLGMGLQSSLPSSPENSKSSFVALFNND